MISTWEEKDIKAGEWATTSVNTVCIYSFNDADSKGEQYGVCYISGLGQCTPLGSRKETAKFLTENRYEPTNKHDHLP